MEKLVDLSPEFRWIGEGYATNRRTNILHYKSFDLDGLQIEIGDFVLVRNDDSLDPNDFATCYIAEVKDLYDTGDEDEPYQAKVQWFSRMSELPPYSLNSLGKVDTLLEIIEDKRSNWSDVIDAETIFDKCQVLFLPPEADYESEISKVDENLFPVFFCRYSFAGAKLIPKVKSDATPKIVIPLSAGMKRTKNSPSEDLVFKDVAAQSSGRKQSQSCTAKGKRGRTKRNLYYCTPVDDIGCPRVIIKKMNDKILESQNGNVRIFVADKDAKNVDGIAESLIRRLSLSSGKSEHLDNDPGSFLNKRPIIHSFGMSQSNYEKKRLSPKKEDKAKSKESSFSECDSSDDVPMDCKSVKHKVNKSINSLKRNMPDRTPMKRLINEAKFTPRSYEKKRLNPKKEDKAKSKESSFSECDSSDDVPMNCKSVKLKVNKSINSLKRSMPDRTPVKKLINEAKFTPRRTFNSKSPMLIPSPQKKPNITKQTPVTGEKNFALTRSGRKVKSLNYSEQTSADEINNKPVGTSNGIKKGKMPKFVRSDVSDDSDNFSAKGESSSDSSSLSDYSMLDEDCSPKKRLPTRKKLTSRKSSKSSSSKLKKCLTLSIPQRKTPLKTPQNTLEKSRQRLHVSAVPKTLPCREEEYSDIYCFVKGCLSANTGGCMYVSGVPGTGKTATVHEVVRNLEEERDAGDVPIFSFVEINGMWMTDPYQCYVQIFKSLTGKTIASQQAATLLEKRFTEPGPKKDAVVLLVDELDRLWTRKQTVMYNIFDWPSKKHSKLVVIAVANTMDLPERLMMNRISSRLGLTRKTFQPYTFKQLQEIIMSRIQELKTFDPDAVQLVARKVAAVSGDARRALDICRFATEVAGSSKSSKSSPRKGYKVLVGMEHVDIVLQQMFSSPLVSAIRSSSNVAKLFFRSILSEFNRTGTEETTLLKIYQQVTAVCRFEGLEPPNSSEIFHICSHLAASHLILVDNFQNALHMKIRLNVSSDDVNYALTGR